jgi:mono/diheme cytochrome c family protein
MKLVPGNVKARLVSVVPALAVLTFTSLTSCAATPTADAGAGEHLYEMSCAGCHGANARGNGPVAPILRTSAPDLTLIASRRGGSFPDDEIYRIVDGQADLSAHGPRNMPVWGYEFFGQGPDDEAAHRQATRKIESLLEFLRSIQRTANSS